MMNMINKAFSLIELMVVVAIIAVLASIAVPVYQQYVVQGKVAQYMAILNSISLQLQDIYAKTGSFPSSISYNGITINGNWTLVNYGNIYSIYYSAQSATAATFALNISGLGGNGIPNYIDPVTHGVSPNGAGQSAIVSSIRDINGTLRTVCGESGSPYNGEDIPLQYLPASCQCTNVNAFAQSGTISSGC